MSVSIAQRLFAFFGNVWSFILTLVRSLLALFSSRRHSADRFTLPRVNRAPQEALVRAHTRLRPILLTPRSIALHHPQRVPSTRTRSATSTLIPGHDENATAAGSVPDTSGPQRTSPKLDPHDAELGLLSVLGSLGPISLPEEGTPDTATGSPILPLTPPDRCYLAPLTSATDCPYVEPWPTNITSKPKLPASALKTSIDHTAFPESLVHPIGSPPPGHWSPLQIWTSTPLQKDNFAPDLAVSQFDHTKSTMDASALANISHALISRSRSSIHPYDDASSPSASSEASPFNNAIAPIPAPPQQVDPSREWFRTQTQMARSKKQQLYPQFHHPDAYAHVWRRRAPGKPNHATRTHAHTRSYSHLDMLTSEWYDADAYAPSPVATLSPPRGDSTTEDEDEDEVPLSRLRDRLARRGGATIELGVPVAADDRKTVLSPRTRRRSEGCLLAISESTPTRVGVGAISGRNVVSLALDGGGNSPTDWLDALLLRFPSEQAEQAVPYGTLS